LYATGVLDSMRRRFARATVPQGITSTSSLVLSVQGNHLTVTQTCPPAGAQAYTFTATPTTVTVFEPATHVVEVYTKQ
jgi:hypothetical protein